MRELGRLSDADYEAARREPVRARIVVAASQTAPYFADHVRQEMEVRFGNGALDARDVRVFTTLDLTLQRLAENAVERGLVRLEARRPQLRGVDDGHRLQAVLVALDPTTGQIRALVGGRSYQASQFNRATLAHRQPGSAFKPFVYAAALAAPPGGGRGFTAATFLDDSPLTLTVNGAPWSPRNYEDRYQGRVTVREALQQSLNAATVRLAQDVGLPTIEERAHAFGIESRLAPVPAMALGSFEVTPLELARAYLPFLNGGQRTPPAHAVRAVQDPGGALDVDEEPSKSVMSPAEAYLMTSLLEGVITAGTGASARALGVTGAVAGKTGTTNDGRDAWFVGGAPGLLAAALTLVALAAAACAPTRRQPPTAASAPTPTPPGARALPPEARAVWTGTASWYGEAHHRKKTASGEPFDMHALTAAHRTLPFGTRVLVTNLANGRAVEVRINDRGPVVHDRIIDLSYGAARALDAVGAGVFRVRIAVLE